MKITFTGASNEIESIINRISFADKDTTAPPIETEPKEEVVTKTITLPNIFDTTIERVPKVPEEIEVISEVHGKVFTMKKNLRPVDVTFEDGTLFKRFISSGAASLYFNKTNLASNITHGFKFRHQGIWFNIQYSK